MLMDTNFVTTVQCAIKWDELWCPCCGNKLRTRPRHSKYKAKLRIKNKKKSTCKKLKIKKVVISYCMHNSSLELTKFNDFKEAAG
jgi:hypothetical protein